MAGLTRLYETKDLTKAELARRSGISEAYLHQVFAGRRNPSRDRLLCICVGLGITLDETQRMLTQRGYAQLYPRTRRDAIISYGVVHQLPLGEINDKLFAEQEKTLFWPGAGKDLPVRKTHCKYKDNEREAEDKKLTTILLAVAMTLPLVACGGGNAGNTNGGNTNSGSTDKHTHVEKVMPAVEPTCTKTGLTEGKRCSECGEVLVAQETVPALGRTTESGTCERCGQSFGDWRIDYSVDDFNQPTDEWYITEDKYLVGTFSNSATTNSKLYANVMVDLDDNVMIFLYEYGSRQVKNSSERYWDEYNITMRTPDGADHKITGTMYCGDDRVNIDDAYIGEVLTALKGEGNVMFRIENADRTV